MPYTQLDRLAPEIHANIADFLPLRAVLSLRQTCRVINLMYVTSCTKLDRRDFGYSTIIASAIYWYWKSPSHSARALALQIIAREICNGASLDEEITKNSSCFLPLRSSTFPSEEGTLEWQPYCKADSLFQIVIYLGVHEVLKMLQDMELFTSIGKTQLLVETIPINPLVKTINHDIFFVSSTILQLLRPESIPSAALCAAPWNNIDCPQQNTWFWTDADVIYDTLGHSAIRGAALLDEHTTLSKLILNLLLPITPGVDQRVQVVKQQTQTTQPNIPLHTVSILYCERCGRGFVLGWFDWVIEHGKLVEGTRPTEWAMLNTTCDGCVGGGAFEEFDCGNLVSKWLGDISMGPNDMTTEVINGKAPFSWCAQHFRFFILSDEGGLEHTETRNFPRTVPFFPQWFKSNKGYCSIEISSPTAGKLPQW